MDVAATDPMWRTIHSAEWHAILENKLNHSREWQQYLGDSMILKNGNRKTYVLQNQHDHSTEWLHPMERIDAGRNGVT
eukprot:5121045-Pleurochrysis_carterae.AAC.1